jgi:hypothetical protein
MTEVTAQQVNALMLEFNERLHHSLWEAKSGMSDEEFTRYRRAVGKILGEMLIEVMNPLYEEYPTLRPAGLPAR